MFGYYEMMRESYLAHKNFKREWSDWRNGKLKKDKKTQETVEPKSVTNARNEFFKKSSALYSLKIEPLEKRFRAEPHSATAELAEFLSVDIPAFRTGYAKEIFLQRLKNIELTTNEIKEFQRVALKICETDNVRREFRRWCRLMTKFADVNFILSLEKLSKSKNYYPKLKSKWMLEMIRQQRMDLRNPSKNESKK